MANANIKTGTVPCHFSIDYRIIGIVLTHYLLSRLIFFAGIFAPFMVANSGIDVPFPPLEALSESLRKMLDYGDRGWYESIANTGYSLPDENPKGQKNWAFFPFLPILISVLGSHATQNILGFVVGLGAVLLVAIYTNRRFGRKTAFITVTMICYFPFSQSLHLFRPESFMLCFWMLTLLLVGGRLGGVSALFGFIAALCKPNGFLISVPLLYRAIRKKAPPEFRYSYIATLAPLLGLLSYSLFTLNLTGDAFAWSKAQAAWGSQFMIQPLHQIKDIFHSPTLIGRWGWDFTPGNVVVFISVQIATINLLRRKAYDLAIFLAALSWLSFVNFGFWVQGRHASIMFPYFISLALTLQEEVRILVLAIFAGFLGIIGVLSAFQVNAFFV